MEQDLRELRSEMNACSDRVYGELGGLGAEINSRFNRVYQEMGEPEG